MLSSLTHADLASKPASLGSHGEPFVVLNHRHRNRQLDGLQGTLNAARPTTELDGSGVALLNE